MSARLVIVTEIISPYRIPLFNALSRRGQVDPHVIFLAETDPGLRQWQVYKDEIRFSYEVLRSRRWRVAGHNILLNLGIRRALDRASPDAVLCGGYNYLASWQALAWAQTNSIPFVLWSESNSQDLRAGFAPVELLKHEFLNRCSAFVVPGQSAKEYLLVQGIYAQSIFIAVNAVDNDRFAECATVALQHDSKIRADLKLPKRYFLFVGRLVQEKGVFDLLVAYSKLNASLREQIGLVFVGDGPGRDVLEQEARGISPGEIRFSGFAQRERVAEYYALADALILPTYSDPWGLVVNEAMACALPVILSRAAGCAADLVTDRWNGLVVEPRDIQGLCSAMQDAACQNELRATMRSNARERIAAYSPDSWSAGIETMMQSLRGVDA